MLYSNKEKKYIIIISIISILTLLLLVLHSELKIFGLFPDVSLQKYTTFCNIIYNLQLIFILTLFGFLYFSIRGAWRSHVYGKSVILYIISILVTILYLFFNYPYTTWPNLSFFGWTIFNCLGIVFIILFLCLTMKAHK